jgi:hypothetical protein
MRRPRCTVRCGSGRASAGSEVTNTLQWEMTPLEPEHPEASALVVYGAAGCEDTAVVRSRLAHLGVLHHAVDVDADPAADALVRRLNGGDRVTPTLVRHGASIAEPSLEQLDRLLLAIQPELRLPAGDQLYGDVTARPVPLRALVRSTPAGPAAYHAETLRGRREVALFLAHDAACLACLGYARQLALRLPEQTSGSPEVMIVVPDTPQRLEAWHHALSERVVLVADEDGAWASEVRRRVGLGPDVAAVVLLDRYLAPRVRSVAPEAGGLIGAADALEWLEYLAVECGECAPEAAWDD